MTPPPGERGREVEYPPRGARRVSPRIPLPRELVDAPFTVAHARRLGLGGKRLAGRDLLRPFHGVRSSQQAMSLVDLCLAYGERMPRSAFFCSVTAARLLGVPLPRRLEAGEDLHVGVPSPSRAPRARGIVGHKLALGSHDLEAWNGMTRTTAGRTWIDLAATLTTLELVAAGDYLIHRRRPLVTLEELELRAQCRAGVRGSRKLGAAVSLSNDRSESPKESEVRVILVQAGIGPLAINHPVLLEGLGVAYRLDIAIPHLRIAIEYQGDYHRDPLRWRADMTRRSRLEAAGWFVIELAAGDLDDPAELVARIARVVESRR